MKYLNHLPIPVRIVLAVISLLPLAACSSDPNLVPDIIGAITGGVATVADINTVATAVNQADNGQPINLSTLTADAQAASTSINSSGLASTAQTFGSEINTLITDLKASGATTPAVINAVASTTATAQVVAAAVPAGGSTTFYFDSKHQHGLKIVRTLPSEFRKESEAT